jgi:predicted lipid-binding transport protein (Tim44 family)
MRPAAPAYQPPPMGQSGGFLRSMAGGIAGGLLGGMLFRGLGFGGAGGGAGGSTGGGGGIGLFEIILLAGIGYLIYRFIKKRREAAASYSSGYDGYQQSQPVSYSPQYPDGAQAALPDPAADLDQGLAHVRQMDASFDEERFRDTAMDIFFKIQGAWMNRDLSPVGNLLSEEMKRTLQTDVDQLLRDKRVNRLENIAVRDVEIVEAWQESGEDYLMVLITANLLDYTTDDVTGQVVTGSKTDPVKFQEFWTFRRSVGPNPWRLTAIDQK